MKNATKAVPVTKPAAPVAPVPDGPTAHDHAKLLLTLQILAAVVPAVAAPFIKNANSQQIAATESGVLNALLAALAKK